MPAGLGSASMKDVVTLALVSCLALAGCTRASNFIEGLMPPPTPSPVIDTWPVGQPADCSRSAPEIVSGSGQVVARGAPRCPAETAAGLAGLDARNPGHAPVVSTELHQEGVLIDPATGEPIFAMYSGGQPDVLVAHLADGSTLAIGVHYPGVSLDPLAIPWNPCQADGGGCTP
jgi:hypothetical protein